jgi:two-component sensor histidine kinase
LASTTTIRSSCLEIVLRSLILLIAVKNLLTRVALVAKDMRPDSGSLDEYIQAFDRRIESVADAHALLSQNRWDGVDLAELVRRQLAPNATDAKRDVAGPGLPMLLP